MITISAYTEPVPVSTINELPQTNEDEDLGESSEFAQLLAGLLQNTEKIQTDIPLVDFSAPEINFEAIPADELIDVNERFNLFENTAETVKPNINDASDETQEDYFNAFASVENLLNSSLNTDIVDTESFQNEPINKISVNNLQETGLENNFSLTDFLEDVSLSADAAVNNEEAFSETDSQNISSLLEKAAKDRISSPKDNVETLSSAHKSDSINKPENENRSRIDEKRGRSRRDRVNLEVRDLRTETDTAKIQRPSVMEASVKRTGEAPVREITLELRLPYEHNGSTIQQGQILETKSGNSGSVNSAFENLLARELHQNFNGDIVRHASMALRDGGEGTIKISLKPESLGNVKIHLEMTENKITGHIVVESKEALNAFRKEIASLEQAFRDSGFTNADLNLSLTSNGQNAQGREQDASSFTPMMAASRYDDSSFFGDEHDALLADFLIERKPGSINMFA